jgi:hypothetical protein
VTRCRPARAGPIVLLAVAWSITTLSGQSITVNAVADALRVRAPGFGVIKGEMLNRLRNGRTVRFELELAVLPKPGVEPATRLLHAFVLSYDLWEERFAVTLLGPSSRSISHLRAADADAWSVAQLAVPMGTLGQFGRGAPFWVRLEYRIEDGGQKPTSEDEAGYTLRGLIDILSRRRSADELRGAIEAGPFRVNTK